jgi:hypothetical protein
LTWFWSTPNLDITASVRGKMLLYMTDNIKQHSSSWFRTLHSFVHGYQCIRIISPQEGYSSFLKNTEKTLQDYLIL